MKTINISPGLHFKDVIKSGNYDLDDDSLYFLLPDIPSTVQAEQVFIEKNGLWGDRLLTFAKLAGIVNINLQNPPNLLSRTARLLLIEQIISDLFESFNYYTEIVDSREFSDSILRVIADLKHSNVSAKELKSIENKTNSETFAKKIDDFCKICSEYDSKLKSINHVDDIDALRLLIEQINKKQLYSSFPALNKIAVFGFTEFTQTQTDVLECLNKINVEIDVYDYDLNNRNNEKVLKSFDSIVEESQYCAKKIKWLIDSESIHPSKIAVINKSNYPNSLIIKEEFNELGIEYSENTKLSLKSSLIGNLILSIINLKLSNFKSIHLFQFLRNPYVMNSLGNVDEFYTYLADLELFFLKEKISSGSSNWSKHKEYLKIRNNSKFTNHVLNLLGQINKSITSKSISKLNSGLLAILEDLVFKNLQSNELINSISEINAAKSALSILSEFRFIVHSYYSEKKVKKLNDYYNIVSDLLSDKTFSLTSAHEENKIKILDYLESRGTSFEYLFILGTSENIIPDTRSTDPIFKNNERYHINRIFGKHILKTKSEFLQSEEQLIHLSINLSKRVFITYVSKDDRGSLVQPTYLLNDYDDIDNMDDNNDVNVEDLFITEHDKYNYLLSKAIDETNQTKQTLKHEIKYIVNGINSEKKRHINISELQNNEGMVGDDNYLTNIDNFSVTQLETYGSCPFRYFASHILKLRFPEEIEDEPQPLVSGSLYHDILNQFFNKLSDVYGNRLDFRTISDEELLSILKNVLESMKIENEFYWLSEFRKKLNFKSIIERILPAFVLKEAQRIREYNSKGFFPKEFEKELTLKLNNNSIEGKADRIDLSENQALVIDYKLRSISNRTFSDYKNLQLPLYLNSYSDGSFRSYGGYYRSIEYPDKESGKNINSKDYDKDLELSLSYTELYIANIKKGLFPPTPQQKDINFYANTFELSKEKEAPCNYCEYSDLCRAKGGAFRTLK